MVRIRRNEYTVVGLTRRMVNPAGDPMMFIPLKDAQEAQFLKDNEAIVDDRNRLAANPRSTGPACRACSRRSGDPDLQPQRQRGAGARRSRASTRARVADNIARWKRLQAYTRDDMEEILVATLIASAAKQIGLFLLILAIVSIAIVAFIIYTMTLGKIKEIAVLKLIGTRDRTIAAMIMQEALGLGVIGFFVGKFAATLWGPVFPQYVLLETGDAARGFVLTLVVCALASAAGDPRRAQVDPAEAIGG